MKKLEELIISKGTIIHLNGIPFELSQDTNVLGLQSNLDLALNWSNQDCSSASFSQVEHSVDNPTHAASADRPVANPRTSKESLLSKQEFKTVLTSDELR
ncbi:hypothetical protein AAX29_00587 [Aliarcobacter thereius]|uniref:Uncharacterized protein n=1 Tax=Aliarcobacter thereius TaxID=544718 RepID=A0A1C0B7G9_9BACT|nr:hypothetical protein [Aliarcobacter thereius]OCL99546.1 hypothetical protein AAX29_00587 [Aliarcobacter thereius]